MKRLVITFAAVANLVLIDAIVKEYAVRLLKGARSVAVIPGFFDLAYVENRGCAWGLLQGRVWWLAVFALAVLLLLIWRRRSIFGDAWAAPILLYAGVLGNLIDRVFRGVPLGRGWFNGYVVDIFDFHWRNFYHFPCFNVADVCICVAAGLLILSSVKADADRRKAS